jgi:hypothetical protein
MECLFPVEEGARWWDRQRWRGCGLELGTLASKIAAAWAAAAGSPTDPRGTLLEEEQAWMRCWRG